MNRSDFEKSIYIKFLEENLIMGGKYGLSEIANMAILAADKFYEEKNKDLQKQYPEISIYDHNHDYGNDLVTVIHDGEFYYVKGVNSIRIRSLDNANY